MSQFTLYTHVKVRILRLHTHEVVNDRQYCSTTTTRTTVRDKYQQQTSTKTPTKMTKIKTLLTVSAFALFSSATTYADGHGHSKKAKAAETELCSGFGPQTPRDIDSALGTNKVMFKMAENTENMNLCNIHFHRNAEHKAAAFSILEDDDPMQGYQCGISKNLSKAELAPTNGQICKGLKPGDTIEVHWVHSSCDVAPGPGLGSCLSDSCANPELRVETQVFTLVNDSSAMNFADFDYQGKSDAGYHMAKWPTNSGKAVEFAGSTTGPSYSEAKCSPLQVGWSVRPQCAKLDINSVGKWCESNKFDEDHAHGVRPLVTSPALLSEIK